MADPQFEQFQKIIEKLPQHIRAPVQCYRLIHELSPDTSLTDSSYFDYGDFNSSNLDVSCPSKCSKCITSNSSEITSNWNHLNKNLCFKCRTTESSSDAKQNFININLPLKNLNSIYSSNMCKINATDDSKGYSSDEDECVPSNSNHKSLHSDNLPPPDLLPIRSRRKLPDIPKNKKPLDPNLLILKNISSLAEELFYMSEKNCKNDKTSQDLSPDDSKPKMDVDSGTSTAYSPVNPGSNSPSPLFGLSSMEILEKICRQLEPTHHVLHKFVPRHSDELELEIGDPIYVQKEAEDLWCEGINLRTYKCGIFPCAHIVDIEYADFDPELSKIRKERFLLDYLGSVKVNYHKGNDILCQAIRKVIRLRESLNSTSSAFPIILEIGEQGIRMLDRNKPPPNHVMTHDYFYNLKNVSFCGYHPSDQRYFGFMTKHPVQDIFACHVFKAEQTTRDVTDAVGRAFHRFYDKFMETAFPIEDIYIE